MSSLTNPVTGSFRDPSGYVRFVDGRILRAVSDIGCHEFEAVEKSGFLTELVETGDLVSYRILNEKFESGELADAKFVLEHKALPYISYPYEWCFPLIKAAALFHLDIQIRALERGISLSDASAYNVQFIGAKPIFIDHLSFKPYQDGEYWLAHRQFCEHFLIPLLLRSVIGIPHNEWLKGSFDGLPSEHFLRLIPLRRCLSIRMLEHIVLPVFFNRRPRNASLTPGSTSAISRPFPRVAYERMLRQLSAWIARLQPRKARATTWATYAQDNTYDEQGAAAKRSFVEEFIRTTSPASVIDLGCNTGDYAELALQAGAGRVLGFDSDQAALELAYHRATRNSLDFLPLYLDATNPSPDLGWRGAERMSFGRRSHADSVLVLAFLHHLCIARNIPLQDAITWVANIAPKGVIEFVPKEDPTVQVMLGLKKDIFVDYTERNFEHILSNSARIVRRETITQSGRTLYRFERH